MGVEAMRELDRRAVVEHGLDVVSLMEVAGASLAREAAEMRRQAGRAGHALVLAGAGNNGGDGLAAARHLRARGVPVRVLLWGDPERMELVPRRNLDLLRPAAVPVLMHPALAETAELIHAAGVVLDCLFGTGFHGVPRAPLPDVIAAANASGAPILSADIPSGLSGDLGLGPAGPCIRASRTLCMGAVKAGLFAEPGRSYAGTVLLEPLGLPEAAWHGLPVIHGLTEEVAASLLPLRRPVGHKGTYGTVLVLAGSVGMAGAPALCAEGALRSGCGLCRVAHPDRMSDSVAMHLAEATLRPLPTAEDGTLAEAAGDHLPSLLAGVDAVVAGPGLGRSPGVRRTLEGLLGTFAGPMVLDADGLNVLDLALVRSASGKLVLTPHPGEAARLLGLSVGDVQGDRLAAVRRLAAEGRCVAVLKGPGTLVGTPEGTVACNPTGNDGMGTGGTGDVLAGIIGGLLAQGLEPVAAASAGVYLHGLAGDLAAVAQGRRALLARDVLAHVPPAFRQMLGAGA